jgi:alkaline phosphatase D
MLGETQWKWLEEQLQQPADLRVMVSSIQVLNDGTIFEAWRHLPKERDRLYDLIRNKSVLLLSGDRHIGGFYETALSSTGSSSSSSVLVEVTSSSFTHTVPLGAYDNCTTPAECDEADPARIGDSVRENHFGALEIDWEARKFTVALRRAESASGAASYTSRGTNGGAGEILHGSREYSFPF